ncbi:universal stress protein [Halegenticoccus soli]|uniref:universal stress protein n=1 Tax=Halegenticoccus soli TaxID=1985678 RepID=UPI000C6DA7BE|nr:universal stress protein [Halegenticoccus soli]
MYETILVPTDGSSGSTLAAKHAFQLAETFDATVHAVHAVDTAAYDPIFHDLGVDRSAVRTQSSSRAFEPIEAAAEEANRPLVTEVVEGAPHEAILRYADENGVDLVVMGTHGRTGVERFLIGSVAVRVVRLSDAPVVTVRTGGEEPTGSYDDVLVPTDGSDYARAAADRAIAVAEAYGATVHALNVVDLTEAAGFFDAGGISPEFVERLDREGAETAEGVAETAREAGLRAVADVRHGTPHREIREYASENGIDLIAMGTHGRTGVGRYALGSVTERVVRTADAPLLTVRGPPEQEEE